MVIPKKTLREVMMLSPAQKTELVDLLIYALDKLDPELDKARANRDAYQKGELKAIAIEEVLSKYK